MRVLRSERTGTRFRLTRLKWACAILRVGGIGSQGTSHLAGFGRAARAPLTSLIRMCEIGPRGFPRSTHFSAEVYVPSPADLPAKI